MEANMDVEYKNNIHDWMKCKHGQYSWMDEM